MPDTDRGLAALTLHGVVCPFHRGGPSHMDFDADHFDHEHAAAILPAFLADPRTHEVFAERIWDASDRPERFDPWIDQPTDAGKETREYAAAILGVDPGDAA